MRCKWGRNCPNPCYPGLHPSPLCTTAHNRTPPKAGSITEKPGPPDARWREAKSNGEKERYSHLNAEFQRIARRDKKAFLSDQCKEIEENNRMGKTRNLFKKIRDIKGTFQAKVGSIKDRNGRDLEKEMATHSSILAWRIPWTEEPGGLLSIGSCRVGRDWSDLACIA